MTDAKKKAREEQGVIAEIYTKWPKKVTLYDIRSFSLDQGRRSRDEADADGMNMITKPKVKEKKKKAKKRIEEIGGKRRMSVTFNQTTKREKKKRSTR